MFIELNKFARIFGKISRAGLMLIGVSVLTLSSATAQNSVGEPMLVPAVSKSATPPPPAQHLANTSVLADVVDAITPAVVNIVVRSSTGKVTTEGQGSGFIISPIGEIVTNYHVIDGGTEIIVVFKNGISFDARIVGSDPETDLALLKIDSPEPFHYVKFHEGRPIRIGDWVVAIGNPYGIGQSTSLGIISAIGRDRVESGSFVDYIQTDATINQGNSGGPLFSPSGQVVGVNSAIFSPTGASVGIGFSIPHQTVQEVVASLRQYGEVRRGFLGAKLRTVEFSGGHHLAGAIIQQIVPGSPAEQRGLKVDDVILEIEDQLVNSSVEATRLIGKFKPGDIAHFLIERAEHVHKVEVKIGERPAKGGARLKHSNAAPPTRGQGPRSSAPAPGGAGLISATGMSLVDLSATFRKAIGMRSNQTGVYVESVLPGSPAARRGLKANIVLMEADHIPLTSVNEFGRVLSDAKRAGKKSSVLLVREVDGAERYVTLSL